MGKPTSDPSGLMPVDALGRLQEGNRRFVLGTSNSALRSPLESGELGAEQCPFAVVLGCSDSRVPVEIVFDQSIGDLFVVRVAGNITAPSVMGSIEFAVTQFDVGLVVVLGHSQCGAIRATMAAPPSPPQGFSQNIASIIDRIRPSVEASRRTEPQRDLEIVEQRAVRANVCVSADALRFESEVLKRSVQKGDLLIVGAEYSLETRVVDFFDGVPPS